MSIFIPSKYNVRVAILSAEHLRASSLANSEATDTLATLLERAGYSFRRALGSYKGTTENSFIVKAHTDDVIKHLRDLAWNFNQESILIIDEWRNGHLLDVNTQEVKKLGALRTIEESTADNYDAWTLVGGQYYVVE